MKSKLNITTILILICLFCNSCHAQTDKSYLNNWIEHNIPLNKDSLNNSTENWHVYLKNDSIRVIDFKHYKITLPFPIKSDSIKKLLRGKLSILKVNNGYLIGSYRGEWGGDLRWFSNDGKSNYKISDDEIVQFIVRGNDIYAIQGLAHLGLSEGDLIAIKKDKEMWMSKNILKLPTAPNAIVLDEKQDFIIITSKSLIKVDEKLNTSILIDKGIWYDSLTPNSLIFKNGVVYAGMWAGVYKYNLLTKKQGWLQEN